MPAGPGGGGSSGGSTGGGSGSPGVGPVDLPDVPTAAVDFLTKKAGYLNPIGNAPVTLPVTSGQLDWPDALRHNATQLDLLGRYASGSYCLLYGLNIEVPETGLTVTVKAGHALIDNVVELVDDAEDVPVPNNGLWNYIWLTRPSPAWNATPVVNVIPDDVTPPAASAYLGAIKSDGFGNLTDYDVSGVLYYLAGNVWRATGQAGYPTDTPPANSTLFTRTEGGLFFWDGIRHTPVDSYDIAGFVNGTPDPDSVLMRFVASRAFRLPAGMLMSVARAEVPPTIDNEFVLNINSLPFAAFLFAAGFNVATFGNEFDMDFVPGDVLTVTGPLYADATLADIAWTFWAVLQ